MNKNPNTKDLHIESLHKEMLEKWYEEVCNPDSTLKQIPLTYKRTVAFVLKSVGIDVSAHDIPNTVLLAKCWPKSVGKTVMLKIDDHTCQGYYEIRLHFNDSKECDNFFNKYQKGLVKAKDIDDYIDQWHQTYSKSDRYPHLHDFLGLTEPEYEMWCYDVRCLPAIAKLRLLHQEANQKESDKRIYLIRSIITEDYQLARENYFTTTSARKSVSIADRECRILNIHDCPTVPLTVGEFNEYKEEKSPGNVISVAIFCLEKDSPC